MRKLIVSINRGFTLIELLVTMIIVGLLASLALPMLLGQVAKGRQTEAKSNLGAINRAQQAYRFEKSTFGLLGDLTVTVRDTYYDYIDDSVPDALGASHLAIPKPQYRDDIVNYALAVGENSSHAYNSALCEDETPVDDDVSTTNTGGDVDCVNGVRLN
jgi:prepilin-type N-terminal cleavage/methylation domain-containing protein